MLGYRELFNPTAAPTDVRGLRGWISQQLQVVSRAIPREYVFDVHRFGAKGDGVTDDRKAIQAAINEAKAANGGDVILGYRHVIKDGLDLTGMFFSTPVRIIGRGRYSTFIKPAYVDTTRPVFDLSGSCGLTLHGFNLQASGSHGELFLLSRVSGDASSGFHTFNDVVATGNVAHGVLVLWGSEENRFWGCEFNPVTDAPAIAAAVKISELGFTPGSDFQTLGTGAGGVGMNGFYHSRFANEQGLATTHALVKIYGGLGWKFDTVYTAHPGAKTYEICSSTYPANAANAYPAVVTFDTCSDEDAWTAAPIVKDTIYVPTPGVTALPAIKGLSVRNCQFFNITGANNAHVDGLVYEGGKYANSVASPESPTNGKKISIYKLTNSRIAPSKSERSLSYEVRSVTEAVEWIGIDNGKVAAGAGTYRIIDADGLIVTTGGVHSYDPTDGIGYGGGAGGTVTQATSATTVVTIDKVTGRVTTVSQTLAAGAATQFQVNNSAVTSVDGPRVWIQSYTGAGDPVVDIRSVATGAFVVRVRNVHATDALNAAIVIGFHVIKGAIS